jgi:hypothetical protein
LLVVTFSFEKGLNVTNVTVGSEYTRNHLDFEIRSPEKYLDKYFLNLHLLKAFHRRVPSTENGMF